MIRKSITINGVKLSYLDNDANSTEIIFFIHGNSGSARYWHKQYNDRALQSYRLIVFDLPAHGESDASTSPIDDYSLIGLGHTMMQAVLAIATAGSSYVLVGLSLGTNIIAEMLAHKQVSPKGIVLISSCIAGGEFTPDKIFKTEVDLSFFFTDMPDAKLVETGFAAVLSNPEEQKSGLKDYYQVRLPFRSALAVSVAQGKLSDEIALVCEFKGDVLVVFGRDEVSVNPDYLDHVGLPVWRNRIEKLPGNHIVNMDSPDEVNALLYQYCQQVFLE
ncbi:MAG: alpha/beta hydrolase [Cyclobacteriaceae bacterium]|nr:alpha/beta hydrolase [Cyclobacteriaceae bacterium]